MTATLLPNGEQTFLSTDGIPLAGGSVYYYVVNTTTFKDTWQDSGETILNSNPIVLDTGGRCIAYGTGQYRQLVKDASGNTIWDQITTDLTSVLQASVVLWCGTSTGSANTQVLTPASAISAYALGQSFSFLAGETNTSSTTFNISTLGAKPVYAGGLSGPQALIAGDIVASNNYLLTYDTALNSGGGGFHISTVDANTTPYTPIFAGGIRQSLTKRLTREVWLDDLVSGSAPTDYATLVTALALALPKGGRAFLTPGTNYPVLSDCTLGPGITLTGPYNGIGAVTANSQDGDFSNYAALQIGSAATITLSQSSFIQGCLVYQQGLTFPVLTSGGFAGAPFVAGGDDCGLVDCLVMGFSQAFSSSNFNRLHCIDCHFDNLSNVSITASFDTCKISGNHSWPYLTDGSGSSGANQRSGVNFAIINSNDWTEVYDWLCFGYQTGFLLENSDFVSLDGCRADNVGVSAFGTGFSVIGSGGSTGPVENRLVNCQASANEQGFYIGATLGVPNGCELLGCRAVGNITHGVLIDAGTNYKINILGGAYADSSNGITVGSADAVVTVDKASFFGIAAGYPLTLTVTTSQVFWGDDNYVGVADGTSAIGGTLAQIYQISITGGVIPLPFTGDLVAISGGGTTGTIEGGWARREITLYFESSTTVVSQTAPTAATNQVFLAGGSTTTFTSGQTLTLVNVGATTCWIEKCRAT